MGRADLALLSLDSHHSPFVNPLRLQSHKQDFSSESGCDHRQEPYCHSGLHSSPVDALGHDADFRPDGPLHQDHDSTDAKMPRLAQSSDMVELALPTEPGLHSPCLAF